MRTIHSRVLMGALIGGGLAILGTGMAHAADTSGADGLLSGDQAVISVDLPVTVGGNAVSVIGDSSTADATTTGGSDATTTGGSVSTDGTDSLLGGNQGIVAVDVPVAVGGNAVSIIGDSSTADATTTVAPGDSGQDASTNGSDSLGGGNQAVIPVEVPVTVGGNALSVIGDSVSNDATTTTGSGHDSEHGKSGNGSGQEAPGDTGSGHHGSDHSGSGEQGSHHGGSGGHGSGDMTTDGSGSLLGGNQLIAPISLPVTVGGNAVSVIGDSRTSDAVTTGGSPTPGYGGSGHGDAGSGADVVTDGADSLLGGNQA